MCIISEDIDEYIIGWCYCIHNYKINYLKKINKHFYAFIAKNTLLRQLANVQYTTHCGTVFDTNIENLCVYLYQKSFLIACMNGYRLSIDFFIRMFNIDINAFQYAAPLIYIENV